MLDHITREGWSDFCERNNLQFSSVHEFRQRFILKTLADLKVLL